MGRIWRRQADCGKQQVACLPALWNQTGKANLGNLALSLGTWACMTPELRAASAHHLCTVHVIYEMLQTLTNSLSVLTLQNQLLDTEEIYLLPVEMRSQGFYHPRQACFTCTGSLSTGARTGWLFLNNWLLSLRSSSRRLGSGAASSASWIRCTLVQLTELASVLWSPSEALHPSGEAGEGPEGAMWYSVSGNGSHLG